MTRPSCRCTEDSDLCTYCGDQQYLAENPREATDDECNAAAAREMWGGS